MNIKILPQLFIRPLATWTEEQATYVAGAKLSRHDHHSLEIKAWVEPGTSDYCTELDCFIFIPSSFQVSRWEKPELAQDFRSRVRLALPSRGSGSESSEGQPEEILERIRCTLLEESEGNEYKRVGSLISEVLKRRGSHHRRDLLMAHSLAIPVAQRGPELLRLWNQVKQTDEFLTKVRSLLESAASPETPIRELLEEYVSNFYVQYLSKLRRAFDETPPAAREKADSEEYRAALATFDSGLGELQKTEANYRQRFPERLEQAVTPEEQEHSVIRLGHLKKFFQSRMFIDVALHSPSSRFMETTAILGTALAGFCWAAVQFLNRPDLASSTSSGSFFLGFAVLTYVLRDRIKDRAKVSLHRRVQKLLPDSNRELHADGNRIGSIKEWFSLSTKEAIPKHVLALRQEASPGEVARNLPEDVLHLRKVISVHSQAAKEAGWALQENTRLNVERYLKYMDDPFKDLAVLDPSGTLKNFRSRRVYHFHIAIGLRSRSLNALSENPTTSTLEFYRAVLDKDGIDRLERLGSYR